jgi:hypothetical protein
MSQVQQTIPLWLNQAAPVLAAPYLTMSMSDVSRANRAKASLDLYRVAHANYANPTVLSKPAKFPHEIGVQLSKSPERFAEETSTPEGNRGKTEAVKVRNVDGSEIPLHGLKIAVTQRVLVLRSNLWR